MKPASRQTQPDAQPYSRGYEDRVIAQPQNHARRCKARMRQTRPASQALPGAAASPNESGSANGEQAIQLYVREIGQVKPLTAQEELGLVRQIKKGNRKARHRLITASLRRVAEISREYENIGLPLLDLISEGNLGLLKAIERFDPAQGDSFAACSTWWIKQSIKRALAKHTRPIPSEKPRRAASQPLAAPIRRNLYDEDYPLVWRGSLVSL
jgi:DNA-directed RNA polymerase sigma subunit (sigma70/sigma32)